MNKKYLKLSIQIIFILLVLIFALYLIGRKTGNWWLFKSGSDNHNAPTATTTDIMTAAEKEALHLYFRAIYEVTARDSQTGKPIKFELVGLEPEQSLSLDIMSDQDKIKLHLATSTKIQVLRRDENGYPADYRIMKDDSDILKQY